MLLFNLKSQSLWREEGLVLTPSSSSVRLGEAQLCPTASLLCSCASLGFQSTLWIAEEG